MIPYTEEFMTSMERAKRFLSQKSRAIAVTIVPLAGLAISQTPAMASAAPLTALTPGTCSVTPTSTYGASVSGDCTDVQESAPDSTGLLGIKMYTTNSSFAPNPITATAFSGGTFAMDISASGGVNGAVFAGTIPVSWDFTLSSSDGGNLAYLLTYTLTGPGVVLNEGNLGNFNVTSGSTISGTDSMTYSGPIGVTGWAIQLQVQEAAALGTAPSITVNVPTNSVDFAPAAATPEPASLFLFGGGLAGLLLRRFRRVKQ
jgi:hypothetical protein